MTGQPQAIEACGLVKRFGDVKAVDLVTLNVGRGELFGFLGPNGAGKTTTINMLTGLVRPDAGTIIIGGIDCTVRPRAAQHLIGVVPDESNLYPELTGFDNLCFCGALYGIGKADRRARAGELLETFGLTQAAGRKFGGYSRGMKRKLTIAAGIIHRPQILFLDEPTTGVDVASARQMRQLIADLCQAGTTIFLTTHYIEEAELLCDRVAFVVSGRVVETGVVEHLLQPARAKQVVQIVLADPRREIKHELAEWFPDLTFTTLGRGTLRVESGQLVPVGPLVRFLEDHGAEVAEARRMRPSLEDLFVRITGIEAEAMRREKEKAGEKR